MNSKDSINKLAEYLKANDAPEKMAAHIQFLEEIRDGLVNHSQSREIDSDIASAVFEYVANHHGFDLDNYEKTKIIINTVFEMACPMAADEEQSKPLLVHLINSMERRANEL
ncbi:MAG: hypothetical protein KZQ77_11485 [Candidatus Thiodiazotropha sp. (ex Notomyrtea botanica)]|nr:hypothetical protein [Candidatus Thiodiazotropha sp. (ex Notomyrtea botanica)]